MKIVPQSAELLSASSAALHLVELAGRVCYKSEKEYHKDHTDDDEDDYTKFETATESFWHCTSCYEEFAKFITMLIERGHLSVLEHASASLRIVTDRGISHELVRHRLASYSQESTRYCNYGKNQQEITVIDPEYKHKNPMIADDFKKQWAYSVCVAESTYMEMIASGVPPQYARSVLPTCLKTELVMTANMREWRHFFELRLIGTSGTPHPGMRRLAKLMFTAIIGEDERGSHTYLRPFFADLIPKIPQDV